MQDRPDPPTPRPWPSGPPPLRIEIRILDDGRVVFGDLPADLAEVAALLAGGTPGSVPAGSGLPDDMDPRGE